MNSTCARARATDRLAVFLCVVVIALGCVSCADLSGSRPPGSFERTIPERRSAVAGELLAIFPGVFYHGIGHRYAGNEEKAKEIFTMEMYSLLPMALGGALWGIGHDRDADALEIAGLIGIGVGGVPFLGTWVYDMVYTPSEVDRFNLRQATTREP